MIPSIIKREFASINSQTNIVWTKCEDDRFVNFIDKACDPCFIIDFENTYFGLYDPSVIICNNRLVYLDKCMSLCRFFHCPLIIVDHDTKPDIVSNKIDTTFDISPVIQIAVSQEVNISWNRIHNYVLDYNASTINTWKNLIYNLCKQKFIIQDIVSASKNENKK